MTFPRLRVQLERPAKLRLGQRQVSELESDRSQRLMKVGVISVQRDGRTEFPCSFLEITVGLVQLAQLEVQDGLSRSQADGGAIFFERLGAPLGTRQQTSQGLVTVGAGAVELECGTQLAFRRRVFASFPEDHAQVAADRGVLGCQCGRPPQFCQGFIRPANPPQGQPQIAVNARIVRAQAQGVLKERNGVRVVPPLA